MCVIIVCTVASRCIRRYTHDLEEQRRSSLPTLARSPYAGTSYQLNILCAPVPALGDDARRRSAADESAIRPNNEANCQRPEGAEPAIVHGNHDAQVSGASGVPEPLHLDLVARAALAGDFGNGRLTGQFLDQAVVRPRPIARGHRVPSPAT